MGLKENRHQNFVNAVADILLRPLKNYQRISSFKNVSADSTGENIFWANRHISFEVYEGEVLGIIGKNGAGKTTLLKMLSRITDPTEGSIEIFGRVASLLEVGTGFHPELTGRENIFLNGTILGLSKKEIEERFDSIVEFSGIKKFLDTAVKKYSSGMKVRLAFAVAAHLEPDILIIDEVLAVGDAEFQKKCLGKMRDVTANEGRTVLFISHDMAAIKNLCTRAILLQEGSIVYEGLPGDVVDYYLNNNIAIRQNGLDLLTRKRTRGDGRFIATGYSILDDKKRTIKITESGKNTIIAINYEVREAGPEPVVLLIIKNNLEQTVFTCLSRNSYHDVMKLKKAGIIYCEIPGLPLQPGEYSVDIILKYGYDFTDAVESAFTLTVEKGDFFGTGKINDDMLNGLFVYHRWRIE
ncbi:MAG: ABC transporter ATP-binding protein [Parafilimonas sp.]